MSHSPHSRLQKQYLSEAVRRHLPFDLPIHPKPHLLFPQEFILALNFSKRGILAGLKLLIASRQDGFIIIQADCPLTAGKEYCATSPFRRRFKG
ncbi:hypothetical protein CEXT_611661 [Caerostris extrusa]|uniref:Uncharacterized protein n=1 Tax=Caerostris extrusa TaxID=172846 RepID=A0AAV4TSL5_CAEEX|nr:hypothetical protein CEXT_611661 [Caerostris extrusa]